MTQELLMGQRAARLFPDNDALSEAVIGVKCAVALPCGVRFDTEKIPGC